MKELRRKPKIILLSALIICSMFGGLRVSSQPIMDVFCPYSVTRGEIINIRIEFEYENVYQILGDSVYLYYSINSGIDYNTYQTRSLTVDRPENVEFTLSTNNLENGDVVRFIVVCDWGNILVKKGTLYSDEHIVTFYEDQSSLSIGTIIGIASSVFALIMSIIITILIRRRKRKKFV